MYIYQYYRFSYLIYCINTDLNCNLVHTIPLPFGLCPPNICRVGFPKSKSRTGIVFNQKLCVEILQKKDEEASGVFFDYFVYFFFK